MNLIDQEAAVAAVENSRARKEERDPHAHYLDCASARVAASAALRALPPIEVAGMKEFTQALLYLLVTRDADTYVKTTAGPSAHTLGLAAEYPVARQRVLDLYRAAAGKDAP